MACAVLLAGTLPYEMLRVRLALALAVALFLSGWVVAARVYSTSARIAPLLVGVALSAVAAVVPPVATVYAANGRGADGIVFGVVSLLVATVTSWAIALWLAAACAGEWPAHSGDEPWWGRHVALIAGSIAFVVLVVIHWQTASGNRLLGDETVMLMQSRWMRAPGFGTMADSALRPYLPVGFFFVQHDRLITQFPPGWPAFLAAARAIGVLPLVGPLAGALAVSGCAALGRRALGYAAGASAALLLLTQSWFLQAGVGYLTHAPTTACGIWAAVLCFRAESASARNRVTLAAGAGLLLGTVVAIRPLTGIAIGASVALWHLLRLPSAAARRRSLTGLALGALGPVLLLLAYNRVTTGAPFTLGYRRAHGSLHSLGFGLRGFRNSVQAPFTPTIAAAALLERAAAATRDLLAPFLVVPVVALACARGARPRWRAALPFLALPAVYAFYFVSSDRFFVDLIPFATIAIAAILWQPTPRPWRTPMLVASLALLNLLFTRGWQSADQRRETAEEGRVVSELERLARDRPLLVLLRSGESRLPMVLHGADSTARVLVYFTSGSADSTLRRRFSGRAVVRVTWDAAGKQATIQPVAPTTGRRPPNGRTPG